MKPQAPPSDALSDYIRALVDVGGQLTSLLNHMYAHKSPANPREPGEVLAGLLADSLPRRVRRRESDLRAAARILDATADAIFDNIFVVADDAPADDLPTNGSERLH